MHKRELVCVMAHADDAEIWAGGLLLIHHQVGPCTILIPDSQPKSRLDEARKGAKMLGATVETFANETEALRDKLVSLKPRLLVTHHRDDTHPDHADVSQRVSRAILGLKIEHKLPEALFYCDTYNSILSTGPFKATHIVDVSAHMDRKLGALAEHASQPIDYFDRMARRQGEHWGARVLVEYAEAFCEVPILGTRRSLTRL